MTSELDTAAPFEAYLRECLDRIDSEYLPGIYRLESAGYMAAYETAQERRKAWADARQPIISQLVQLDIARGPSPILLSSESFGGFVRGFGSA